MWSNRLYFMTQEKRHWLLDYTEQISRRLAMKLTKKYNACFLFIYSGMLIKEVFKKNACEKSRKQIGMLHDMCRQNNISNKDKLQQLLLIAVEENKGCKR